MEERKYKTNPFGIKHLATLDFCQFRSIIQAFEQERAWPGATAELSSSMVTIRH
jgi:hypothetical protein